tara:strand:+ start:102 stop:1085 length:984 start_codon:yes stop_codon:yes gene_type:complete
MLPNFFKELGPIKAEQIKSIIKCNYRNLTSSCSFNNFISIKSISDGSLSFLYNNEQAKGDMPLNSGIICTEMKAKELSSKQKIFIVKNVQEAVAKISNIFYREFNHEEKNKFKKPQIGKNCEIGKNVIIENGVIIGSNVKIDHNSVIKHSCIIGDGSKIGSNTLISNTILGNNIYIGSNSSIGQRGFGFYLNSNKNINIFHSGRVIIKSNASVGSGCTIDRGSFSDTIIGENSFLDNLCHVAHNVKIGNNCAFAAMTGIAGSAKIGDNVLTGGQAGIAGHVTIGSNVQIAAKSGVFNSLNNGESVMGNPAINKYTFIKNYKKIYGKR